MPLMTEYCKTFILLIFLLLISVPAHSQEIRILFTSNSNGKIENCRCPDQPYGALEKRVQFILEYRERHPEVLVLDNGDNFLNYGSPEKEPVILAAFRLIPYDVINLGDQDLAFAPREYFALRPVIRTRGNAIVVRRKAVTFTVLPVIHANTRKFYPENTFQRYKFSDPSDDIKRWLLDTGQKPVFRILLSHSGYEADLEYARRFQGIDLILGGHSQTRIDTLNIRNGIPVLQAGGNAEYVGEVRFRKQGSGYEPVAYALHPMTLQMPTNRNMQTLLNDYHRRIGQ